MVSKATFKFRLYVAGNSQNSSEALANLTAICKHYLADRHEIEVIDVIRQPQRALVDGVRMTPNLVKLAPAPFRRVVGTLAHTKRVLIALDIENSDIGVVPAA
jgi:circadian clock protein KaiB